MRYATWAVLTAILLVAGNYAISLATYLLHLNSDLAVVGGVIILLAVLGFVVWLGSKLWPKIKPHLGKICVVLAIGAMPILGGCSKQVDPGHVGIEVDMYGKDRGVQGATIATGMVWYNPITTNIYTYPISIQTAIWTRSPHEGSKDNDEITYNSSEGLTFTADISLSYQLVPEKVPAFYVKFRSDDLNTFTHGFLRNIARDAFNETAAKYTTDELYGAKKDEVLAKVREQVNAQVADIGVVLQQLGYVGAPRPPEAVVAAINAKIKAIQDAQAAQNKVAQIQAEANQAIAQADGQAKANKLLDASLTPNLIEWRRLQLVKEAVDKWDGHRPMVEGAASGLLLNVSPQQAAAPPAK